MLHTLTLDYRHLPQRRACIVRALLELTGTPRTDAARVPLRLSLVLDRSGSMDGAPLQAATRAAADLVRRLAPEDIVSVVAFDDEVRTIVPPHAGGEEPDAVHRVLLLTDGHANAGITDPRELAMMAAESRKLGVTTSCVAFGDELAGLQTLAGQNLAVTITLSPEVELAHVHHDWPFADTTQGRIFELGDLYAREPKRLLVEFFCVAEPDADALRAIATLTLRADVREPSGALVHETITLPVAATLEGAGEQSPVVQREVRAVLEQSPFGGEMSDELRDLESLAEKFERESATESDARYMVQKAYNARRGKRVYDAGFTRREK